jgi:hypothetical protein
MSLILKKKPSNKGQSPLKTGEGIEKAGHSSPYKLLIDKITILIDLPSQTAIETITSDALDILPDHPKFKSAKAKQGYRLTGVISVIATKKRPVHIQIAPKTEGKPFMRLEFNPAKIGAAGLLELHEVLSQFLPGGVGYLIAHGRLSRLDIAVDFAVDNSRLAMDDLIFFPHDGAPFVREYGMGGHLQTTMLGKGTGNQWKLYRKDKEQKVKKGRIIPATIRIERVLRGQKMKLASLPAMENVFAPTTFSHTLPPRPDWETESRWTLFCDSVKVRGVTNALLLMPGARRVKYRKHIKDCPAPWWNPTAMWEQWQPLLADLKLVDAAAYH